MEILHTDSGHPDFKMLAAELESELRIRDGQDHAFYAELNKIGKIKHVLVCYENDQPVACGGFRALRQKNRAELKRMYVRLAFRQKGIATLLLNELEKRCRELGYDHCMLETGKNQPEAIALYTRNNYRIIPNFGRYRNSPDSICFEKELNR